MNATRAELAIVVHGRPAPQGNERVFGLGRMVKMSRYLGPWREAVQAAAWHTIARNRDWRTLAGPILVRMVFTIARPAGHYYRFGRNAHRLRRTAPARPASVPGLSKLVRATEDALTMAGVWTDDDRAVEYTRVAGVYSGCDPEALPVPGVRITVRRLDEEASGLG